MWPIAGLMLVATGLLPSAALWLRHSGLGLLSPAPPLPLGSLWLVLLGVDLVFVAGALLFLDVATAYGRTRGGAAEPPPAPYPGAWVTRDGRQALPRGFAPNYLSFALAASLLAPAAALLLAVAGAASDRHWVPRDAAALVAAALLPYLAVFAPQVMLETRFLNRSFMTPVLPLLFAPYRFWQLARALALAAEHAPHVPAARPLALGLLALAAFWVFDTGATLLWLPWMFDWQLQDAALLRRLAAQRAQGAAGGGGDGGQGQGLLLFASWRQRHAAEKDVDDDEEEEEEEQEEKRPRGRAATRRTRKAAAPAGAAAKSKSLAGPAKGAAAGRAGAAARPRSRSRPRPHGGAGYDEYSFGA